MHRLVLAAAAAAAFWAIAASCSIANGSVFGAQPDFPPSGAAPGIDALTFSHFLTHHRQLLCSRSRRHLQLNPRVGRYCRSASLSDTFVHAGLINGYKICQSMFKNERWNCTFAYPFLNSGYPQAAFVWAITVSKAIEELVMACRRGVAGLDCQCARPRSRRRKSRQQRRRRPRRNIAVGKEQLKMLNPEKISEKYGSLNVPTCDDNIELASRRVRSFFGDARAVSFGSAHFMHRINFHNRRAGHIVVRRSRMQICNCLGISGSCSKKVCIKGLRRHSRLIETNMQRLFSKSKLVTQEHNSLERRQQRQRQQRQRQQQAARSRKRRGQVRLYFYDAKTRLTRKVRKRLLVYAQPPPQFCDRNVTVGIFGVGGRRCNTTVAEAQHNSCRHLCCGRHNHTPHYVFEQDWCDCKMVYNPIKVQCNRCHRRVRIHRCTSRMYFPFGRLP